MHGAARIRRWTTHGGHRPFGVFLVFQINLIHSFAVLLYEPVNGCDIRRSARVSLRDRGSGDEAENSGEQIARQYGKSPVCLKDIWF